MGDLISEPKIGSYITDQRKPVDTTDVECVFICPSDLMVIIEIDIRKSPLPKRVTADLPTDKTLYRAAGLGQGRGMLF